MSAHVAQLQSENPRIAAGMSVAEWERASKLRRRREWESRAQRHSVDGAPTRSAALLASRTPLAPISSDTDFWRQGTCLDRNIPLGFTPPVFRIEGGMTMRTYFRAKFLRCGSLGEFGALNPFLSESKQWAREARHA